MRVVLLIINSLSLPLASSVELIVLVELLVFFFLHRKGLVELIVSAKLLVRLHL